MEKKKSEEEDKLKSFQLEIQTLQDSLDALSKEREEQLKQYKSMQEALGAALGK